MAGQKGQCYGVRISSHHQALHSLAPGMPTQLLAMQCHNSPHDVLPLAPVPAATLRGHTCPALSAQGKGGARAFERGDHHQPSRRRLVGGRKV